MSKNSKYFKKGSTIECLVCGKLFPRGPKDLARHTNAITLQHLYSNGESRAYPFHCVRCNFSFKSNEHLEQHQSQTSCSRNASKPVKLKKKAEIIDYDDSNVDDDVIASPVADVLPPPPAPAVVLNIETLPHPDDVDNIDDSDTNDQQEVKTMECMVCGKLFPRGPIDLHRHATAITLKHLIANKKGPGFHYGCNACGLYFGSAEHLALHKSKSTCNENMIWPRDAHKTAGLRVIHRSDYNNSVASPAAKTSPKPVKTRPKKTDSNISITSLQSLAGSTSVSKLQAAPSSAAIESRKRLLEAVQLELSSARQKRSRIIVPEERQAFFGVVSLLIDPSKLDSGLQITDDNYEEFIPEEHRPLIERLKNVLLYA